MPLLYSYFNCNMGFRNFILICFFSGHYFEPAKNMSQTFPHRAWILITDLEFLVYDFWTVGVNKLGQSETSDVTEMQAVRRPSKLWFLHINHIHICKYSIFQAFHIIQYNILN